MNSNCGGTGLIGSGFASLFGFGPAAAVDLAVLGCGTPLGLASGIAASPSGMMYNPGFMGGGGYYQGCGGGCGGGGDQVQVIARPILPYFRSTCRGFPKW